MSIISIPMKNKILAYLSLSLLLVEVVMAVGSWIFAALNPESGIHSMLSSEGIRWAFGGFIRQMQSSVLVWLLLAGMAWGALRVSRFCYDLGSLWSRRNGALRYRQRVALRFSIVTVLVYIAVISFFSFVPHAILLSVTGELFPSAFSEALVPIFCFGVILLSVEYGVMSGTYPDVPSVFDALVGGIRSIAPLLILYLLATHVYYVVRYIF